MLPAGMAETYEMDVRDRDAWVASLDAFTAPAGGKLDVLFNNAGIGTGGPLAEMSFEDIDRTVAINLTGVLNGARIGYAYLARTPGSCLLNTASASAIYGSVRAGALFDDQVRRARDDRGARRRMVWRGIKVRDLVPSFIETPLLNTPAGGIEPVDPRDGDGGRARTDPGERRSPRRPGTRCMATRLHTYVGKTARRMAFAGTVDARQDAQDDAAGGSRRRRTKVGPPAMGRGWRSVHQQIDRFGHIHVTLRQAARVVGGQQDLDPVPHVRPFGVMVRLFREQGDAQS